MSLRRRLVITTVALIAVGSAIFSFTSLALLDRALRSQLDARLTTVAHAAADIVDEDRGEPLVDGYDVLAMSNVHNASEHLAVLDRHGRQIFGERFPAGAAAHAFSFARVPIVHRGSNLGSVVAWQDRSWLQQVDRTALAIFSLTALALAIAASLLAGRYARSILVPLERVATLAEEIEGRDLSRRLHADGRDELARLCNSFDRMLERLEQSFTNERRFVADASHELRTPLAVVRAETELALRRERTSEEYRAALASIEREAIQLEALVDQLLETMRTEALATSGSVDVTEVLQTLVDRVRPASRSMRANLRAATAARVCADRSSLERAANAVLHNAIVHGGGEIDVRVDVGEREVRIHVVDDGPGFGADALRHATERFWRGDSARGRGGTGLGLSIARVLVESHGGEVRLANAPDAGAAVTLVLPRAAD